VALSGQRDGARAAAGARPRPERDQPAAPLPAAEQARLPPQATEPLAEPGAGAPGRAGTEPAEVHAEAPVGTSGSVADKRHQAGALARALSPDSRVTEPKDDGTFLFAQLRAGPLEGRPR
jgi:hypothetical protein